MNIYGITATQYETTTSFNRQNITRNHLSECQVIICDQIMIVKFTYLLQYISNISNNTTIMNTIGQCLKDETVRNIRQCLFALVKNTLSTESNSQLAMCSLYGTRKQIRYALPFICFILSNFMKIWHLCQQTRVGKLLNLSIIQITKWPHTLWRAYTQQQVSTTLQYETTCSSCCCFWIYGTLGL